MMNNYVENLKHHSHLTKRNQADSVYIQKVMLRVIGQYKCKASTHVHSQLVRILYYSTYNTSGAGKSDAKYTRSSLNSSSGSANGLGASKFVDNNLQRGKNSNMNRSSLNSKSMDILSSFIMKANSDHEKKSATFSHKSAPSAHKSTPFSHKSNSKGKKQGGGYNDRRSDSAKPKRQLIKFTTGSEKQQVAATATVQGILRTCPGGDIKAIDRESGVMIETKILDFIRGIDLAKEGIVIANIIGEGESKIPLVKIVDSRLAIKLYSQDLAEKKNKELADLGLRKYGSHSNARSSASSSDKDSGLKQIQVSWQISETDLSKQKSNDIVNQLKKGMKVYLYLDSKKNLERNVWLEKFENIEGQSKDSLSEQDLALDDENELDTEEAEIFPKLRPREVAARQQILDTIYQTVEELAYNPDVYGEVTKRMLIKLRPRPSNSEKTETTDKKELKEQKKKERQEKLLKRTAKKQETRESTLLG